MVGKKLKIEARAQNILTNKAGCTGLIQSLFEALIGFPDFTVNIVVTTISPHREGSNSHTFDYRMRVKTHDVAILECTRFAFIGITYHILIARE